MTIVNETPNILLDLKDLSQRVYNLEHKRYLTYDTDGNPVFFNPSFPDGITIGVGDPIFVDETVAVPTGLSLSWGSFFDVIFINTTWDLSSNPQVVGYEIELTKVGQGVARFVYTAGNSVRFEPVEANTQYSVRIRSVNRLGRPSAFSSSVNITTGGDSSIPAQVTGLVATAGFRSILAQWAENTEIDVRDGAGLYEVQIATNGTFTANLRTVRVGGGITSFDDLTTGTAYFVRVRAIDSSGNFGSFSSTASATTQQTQTADYANLSIVNGKIANLAVDDAKIASISAGKITTSTLTATITVSGVIRTSATHPRVTIDSSGMRLTDSAGRITLEAAQSVGQPTIKIGRVTSPFHYLIINDAGLLMRRNGSSPYTGGTDFANFNINTGAVVLGDPNDVAAMTVYGSIIGSTITGGSLTGSTFTGGTFRTAASGRRIEIVTADVGTRSRITFFTGSSSEVQQAQIDVLSFGSGSSERGRLILQAPKFVSSGTLTPEISLLGESVGGALGEITISPAGGLIGGVVFIDGTLRRANRGGYLYRSGVIATDVRGNWAVTTGTTDGSEGRLNINHGLGVAPTLVIATPAGPDSGVDNFASCSVEPARYDSTKFSVRAFRADGTVLVGKSITVAWMAIRED